MITTPGTAPFRWDTRRRPMRSRYVLKMLLKLDPPNWHPRFPR